MPVNSGFDFLVGMRLSLNLPKCPTRKKKNPNAVALGRLGAKARQEKLSPEQRRAIAQKAIRARWSKDKKKRKKKETSS